MNRAQPLATWPIEKPTTAAGKEAAKLHSEWAAKHAQIRAIEDQFVAAQDACREADRDLQLALRDAASSGRRGRAVDAAEDAYVAARAAVEAPWKHRLQAPIAAAEAARAEFERHVSDNLAEILAEPELATEAVAARDEVLARAGELATAFDRLQRSRDAHGRVLGAAADIDARAIPEPGVKAGAVRAAVAELLEDQEGGRPPGREPFPPPCPSQRTLNARAVARREAAREVPVEVDGMKGVQVEAVA